MAKNDGMEILDLRGNVIGYQRPVSAARAADEISTGQAARVLFGNGRLTRGAQRLAVGVVIAFLMVSTVYVWRMLSYNDQRAAWTQASQSETLGSGSGNGWNGVDVDRYGIITMNGVTVGSLHDESGDVLRSRFLAGVGAENIGDPAHTVEDGVRFCALLASGDRIAMQAAHDAQSDVPAYATDARSVRIAAAALVNFCPRFDA